jgi:phenylacetate-CoA ligase
MLLEGLKSWVIKRRIKKTQKKLLQSDAEDIKRIIRNFDYSKLKIAANYKICKTLRHAAAHSPFYKKKLKGQISDLNLRNAEKVLRKFSFYTSPDDLSNNPEEFLALPESAIVAHHFSAGTTGNRKKIFVSKKDLEMIFFSYSLGFLKLGLKPDDVAQIMYSFGIWQLGSLYEAAFQRIGVSCLPTGNHIPFSEQKHFMEEFNTSVIAGTPSYIYNFAHETDLSDSIKDRMKTVLLGGEGVSRKMRRVIEDKIGGEIFLGYGLMEFGGGIGTECEEHRGYHLYTNIYPEIIDPKTGIPVEKEEYGELVLTSLDREAMPLIRYRTGDITRFIEGACDCGLKLPMIDYLKGRLDDRVTLGTAEKYYPVFFEKLFDSLNEVKDFLIEIKRENGKDSLTVKVHTEKPSENLRKKILKKFYDCSSMKFDIQQTKTMTEPDIKFVENIKEQSSLKKKRLIDKRE